MVCLTVLLFCSTFLTMEPFHPKANLLSLVEQLSHNLWNALLDPKPLLHTAIVFLFFSDRGHPREEATARISSSAQRHLLPPTRKLELSPDPPLLLRLLQHQCSSSPQHHSPHSHNAWAQRGLRPELLYSRQAKGLSILCTWSQHLPLALRIK